jgi:D-serine deaminase-like pyridoxal phosphate-dependent protein
MSGSLIGVPLAEVPTPALIVHLDLARENTATMARHFEALPANLRPHIKVHKSPVLAKMAIDAGAVGVACATPREAIVMADAGIEDVLLANQIADGRWAAALAEAAGTTRLTAAVDDERHVALLAEAATAAGATIEILVELDVGMGRCGVRDFADGERVAAAAASSPGLRFRGVQGYEGHCMLEPDRDKRVRDARAANERVMAFVGHLADAGLPSETVSCGGTGTFHITGAHPGVTEVQAGTYALMDAFHERLVPGGFAPALSVLGTVISRKGSTVILDSGRKAVGIDFVSPALRDHPGLEARSWAEEHALFDFPGEPPVDLGDRVELIPGYGPTTVNLHDEFVVIEDGVVVDVWPVAARGH